MSLNINYKQAAKVAAFAVAWEMVAPSSALSTISALAFGIFSTYCVEVASEIKRGMDMSRNERLYCVKARPDFDPEKEVESIKRVRQRLKEYKILYKIWLEAYGLPSGDHDLIDSKVVLFMQNKFKEGTCYGQVAHLLQIAKETNSSFTSEIIAKMNAEEIFYRQILQYRHLEVACTNIDIVVKIKKLKHELKDEVHQIVHPFSKTEKFDEERYKQKKLTKYKNEIENLKKIDPLISAPTSKKFSAMASVETYERILEALTSTLPNKDLVIGALSMDKHILAFQYSPEGYYIYDSINTETGGLLKYPDKETFFQKLREQVLRDLSLRTAETKEICFHIIN